MAFHDVRLPINVERGALGGPRFKTTVLTLANGHENRNIDWENARGSWDVGYGAESKQDFTATIDFFYTRQGQAHSFRFKDWSDFEMAQQVIGQTDGSTTAYQIFKQYTSGAVDFNRNLEKIVSGSVTVIVNSVTITEGAGVSQYQIDLLTGIITLGSTLAAQVATDIEAICEFDVPVRFATDALDVNMLIFDAGSIPQLQIIEVKGE